MKALTYFSDIKRSVICDTHYIFSTEFDQIATYSTQAILWPKRQSDQTFSIEAVRNQESQAVRKVASAIEFLDHASEDRNCRSYFK